MLLSKSKSSGGNLKLLLTSGGVTNPSIYSALVQVLPKPIAECHALCVPTAQWGHPMCGPTSVRGFVAAEPDWRHLSGLGWASRGVLELTALPTIGAERWVPWVREADVLLVDGGRRDVPVPLDAGFRAGRSAAFAA
jgi:dipeptidase E